MTINLSLIGDQRCYGETTAGPARGMGPVSEGIAGGLILVIWQPHHRDFSASHWHPGTSVADDSRRLDGAKSLLGVQIRILGSDRVRSLRCMGVLRQFSRYSCASASSSPCLKTDLRPIVGCDRKIVSRFTACGTQAGSSRQEGEFILAPMPKTKPNTAGPKREQHGHGACLTHSGSKPNWRPAGMAGCGSGFGDRARLCKLQREKGHL